MKCKSITHNKFYNYWKRIRAKLGINNSKTLYTFRRTVGQRVHDAYKANRQLDIQAKIQVADALRHGNNSNFQSKIRNKATFRYFDSSEA